MATQGGMIEQKTIGLPIAQSGTLNNAEIVNGEIRLKVQTVSNGQNVYYEEGQWTSDVVDIGDSFNAYGKIFTTHVDVGGSTITVETRTSPDGITFDSWIPITLDGTIQSMKRRFIQIRVTFYAGFVTDSFTIANSAFEVNQFIENGETVIKLKRNYQHDMKLDSSWSETGSLYRKKITRDDWVRIDRLEVC